MSRKIAILGSTGSIGTNALRVIDALGPQYEVIALSGHDNTSLLAAQTGQYKPQMVALTNSDRLDKLQNSIPDPKPEILTGPDSLVKIVEQSSADIILTAVVGAAGLPAVLQAAKMGKTIAIANKEPLVIAGQLLTEIAGKNNAQILPVDSEHCAIFQCLASESIDHVSRIILTASGGPFRTLQADQLANVTLQDALAHPTWQMGKKITIDSATMMNKALEVIEAKWLFNIEVEKISVLVHPESIIHSMVEYIDGSVIAQMSPPDMCLPIQYALTYPQRCKGISPHLRLDQLGSLTFEQPDFEKFRALKIGYNAARTGGSAPVVFNAANEAAVEHFLAGNISFDMIIDSIDNILQKHTVKSDITLDELLEVDHWTRKEVNKWLKQKA